MSGELQRRVGLAVRRIRSERGLSQEDLAESVGMHRTYVGAVERGERNLTLQSVEQLADRLSVPVDALIQRDPSAR